jgi:putative SOS response-associated peptidase YedK
MLWGFPKYKPGTNFRTLNNSQGRAWLDREHRCVVPGDGLRGADKNTANGNMMWRWFKRRDGVPFFFSGIWRPWTGDRGTKKGASVGERTFSIMTTESNGVVQPVHRQAMPVILMTADRWTPG